MALICRESPMDAPIVSSYNDRIRPLLDCVDKLRHLKIMQEGIQLPTIVVVGDQSSGKSSVLESLAGISLPRGQGICTRVPLIMRLKNVPNLGEPELHLEFNGKIVPTDEESVAEAIVLATEEVAGRGKGISHAPLTLTVKKCGVPDLTMVDLPGITRVPVHGQPEDIYEQISNIIMEYITPEESIILNVLSASVDFSTCESIRMSQKVDKTGERTLAVVTKADRSPEGLLEKVTADDVHIGLCYVCVRNRIGEESYEEARMEEAKLFQSHPFLSKIEKSMVSIPVLAQKLVRIQANIISKCLPEIVRKINDKLSANMADLNRLPQNLNTVAEALTAFMRITSSAKESLRKFLVRGEFDEFPDEKEMHCTARLVEMLNEYADELRATGLSFDCKNFLMEEILALEEAKEIGLPNFFPRKVFFSVLQKRVKMISTRPQDFVAKLWEYIEKVVVTVLVQHADSYPQLQSSMRRASQNLIAKMKQRSVDWVVEIIGMEMMADYSCNPEYSATIISRNEHLVPVQVSAMACDWAEMTAAVEGFSGRTMEYPSSHPTMSCAISCHTMLAAIVPPSLARFKRSPSLKAKVRQTDRPAAEASLSTSVTLCLSLDSLATTISQYELKPLKRNGEPLSSKRAPFLVTHPSTTFDIISSLACVVEIVKSNENSKLKQEAFVKEAIGIGTSDKCSRDC
nr:dynamin-related protein 4C-like [Ipomoea batatas]